MCWRSMGRCKYDRNLFFALSVLWRSHQDKKTRAWYRVGDIDWRESWKRLNGLLSPHVVFSSSIKGASRSLVSTGPAGNTGCATSLILSRRPQTPSFPTLYGMPELQNLPNDGTRHRGKRRRVDCSNYDSNTENDQNTSEDEDGGYDCNSDINEDWYLSSRGSIDQTTNILLPWKSLALSSAHWAPSLLALIYFRFLGRLTLCYCSKWAFYNNSINHPACFASKTASDGGQLPVLVTAHCAFVYDNITHHLHIAKQFTSQGIVDGNSQGTAGERSPTKGLKYSNEFEAEKIAATAKVCLLPALKAFV